MPIPIPQVHMGVGAAAVLVSIPLVLRMVPKNHVYGVRTRKAFVSERNWYEINSFGGMTFLVYGLLLIVFGYLSQPFAPSPTSVWAPVFMVVPFLMLAPVLVVIQLYSRRFPDR